jgi:hypothetical protein
MPSIVEERQPEGPGRRPEDRARELVGKHRVPEGKASAVSGPRDKVREVAAKPVEPAREPAAPW